MSLLTYTQFSEVRAVLGVSATELTDVTLSQPMYGLHILLELEAVAPGVPELFATINAINGNSATKEQKRFVGLVGLFAPYAIAKHLLTSLPMFAVQSLTDGKASFSRQNGVAIYDDVKLDVQTALADIRIKLKSLYYTLSGSAEPVVATVLPVLSIASLRGVDPVTNV